MSIGSSLIGGFFQLLIPLTDGESSDDEVRILCGPEWKSVKLKSFEDAPPFTAISYSWMLEGDQEASLSILKYFITE